MMTKFGDLIIGQYYSFRDNTTYQTTDNQNPDVSVWHIVRHNPVFLLKGVNELQNGLWEILFNSVDENTFEIDNPRYCRILIYDPLIFIIPNYLLQFIRYEQEIYKTAYSLSNYKELFFYISEETICLLKKIGRLEEKYGEIHIKNENLLKESLLSDLRKYDDNIIYNNEVRNLN